MRIQEIAEKTGYPRDMPLYWERLGWLRPAKERNGYRNYRGADCQRVILVGLGKEAGCTLREIASIRRSWMDAPSVTRRLLSRLDWNASI